MSETLDSGIEIDHEQCALCECKATGTIYGFRVCEYHKTHNEDAPLCPTCGHPEDIE